MKQLKSLLLLTLPFVLASCATDGTIFKHQELTGSSVTTTDARQRAIISNRTRNNPTFLRVCAEPFPDIFTVISSSLSASLQAEGEVDEKKKANATIGAGLAEALKESGASIERSQTVNLLAMSLYRTCERYMNGGLTESELKIQAMRDQRAMISILAIEQLTNIARPASVNITLDAGSAESNINNALKKELDEAKVQLDNASNNVKSDQEAKVAALKDSKEKTQDKCSFDDADKQAQCASALQTLKDAENKKADAQSNYDKLIRLSNIAELSAKVSAQQVKQVEAQKPLQEKLSNESITHIVDKVVELAKIGSRLDPYELCLAKKEETIEKLSKQSTSTKTTSELNQLRRNNDSDCEKQFYGESGDHDLLGANIESPFSQTASNVDSTWSEVIFYIQSQKDCIECKDTVSKVKKITQDISQQLLLNHPVEYLDSKFMPDSSQIRYFNTQDKKRAQDIGKALNERSVKVSVQYIENLKAPVGTIEFWVGRYVKK